MHILFIDGIEFQAEGLLYQLKEYGPENACVVDFPTRDLLYNGLAFVFREHGSIANLSVIVHHCYKDFHNTEGYFYNDVKYHVDVTQYIELNLDHIAPLGTKVFATQRSLLERKDCLERMLISEGAIDRFTSFTAPENFCQTLKARRGADYWGNR